MNKEEFLWELDARLDALPVDEREKSLDYYKEIIEDELNVKEVIFEDDLDKYMNFSIKPNFRAAGPVFGKDVKAFGAAMAQADAKELIAKLAEGPVKMQVGEGEYDITEELIDVRISAKEGFVVGMENNVFTILDTTLTPELIEQGYVREIISKIQQLRKQANFEMMDQIRIYVDADEEIKAVIEANKEFIMDETIAKAVEDKKDIAEFDINGHKTGIAVEKL